MTNNDERRKPAPLEEKYAVMLTQIHTILTDENVGLCVTVKNLNTSVHGDNETLGLKARMDSVEIISHKTYTAVYGNGWMGLKVQTLLIWVIVVILGTDNVLVQKIIDRWWK